jgi:hypothetical protein
MKISKHDLCSSCREIRPTLNSSRGKVKGDPIEQILGYKGYSEPMGIAYLNFEILSHLKQHGGCPSCINLFRLATS